MCPAKTPRRIGTREWRRRDGEIGHAGGRLANNRAMSSRRCVTASSRSILPVFGFCCLASFLIVPQMGIEAGHFFTFDKRFLAISVFSGTRSIPMYRRPCSKATNPVVPEPLNGSRMVSP